jgi:hypothetical protein
MARLLIVSPHFPPTNAPDMHRVRLSLPYYRQFGWEPTVLAVDADCADRMQEPDLLQTVPDDVPVHRVRAIPARWTRRVGFSALGLRAAPCLYREGIRLLRTQRTDLIYFSTTMFPAMALGRLWKRRFGVPVVLDMQDPWVGVYYDHKPASERPRKYHLAQRLHKTLEPWTMRAVDGLTAVSESYHRVLRERYPWIRESTCLTLPFGASAADFEIAEQGARSNVLFDPADGLVHGVYAGVLGPVMRAACRALCQALAAGLRARPDIFERVRLHFVGTDYAQGAAARWTVKPISDSLGLGDRVFERPHRIGYLEALRLLKGADFLLLPGSDNPDYTASKTYPYILARRPMLAVFHESSSVVRVLEATAAAKVVAFGDDETIEKIADRVLPVWTRLLEQLPFEPATDWRAFEPYTAREMTRRQCELFNRILEEQAGKTASSNLPRLEAATIASEGKVT